MILYYIAGPIENLSEYLFQVLATDNCKEGERIHFFEKIVNIIEKDDLINNLDKLLGNYILSLDVPTS